MAISPSRVFYESGVLYDGFTSIWNVTLSAEDESAIVKLYEGLDNTGLLRWEIHCWTHTGKNNPFLDHHPLEFANGCYVELIGEGAVVAIQYN